MRTQSLMNQIDVPINCDGWGPCGPGLKPGVRYATSNGDTPQEVSDRISRWAKMGKGVSDFYHIDRFGKAGRPFSISRPARLWPSLKEETAAAS